MGNEDEHRAGVKDILSSINLLDLQKREKMK